MVRTVKTKAVRSLNKGEQAILLPGITGAEPWELWILGGPAQAECVQTCKTPLDNRLRKNSTLALPVSQVFCLPLWLGETDTKQFAGIISLQLELRGLQPRSGGPVIFDWSMVAQEGARTLVTVGVLPAVMPEEMQSEAYPAFDLSARYLPFAENALTLWQEQDRLAMAITRGPDLIYYQALPETQVSQRVLQDLNSIRTTLEMQGVLTPLQQVVVWGEAGSTELAALRAAFRLPVTQGERPSPRLPTQPWKLTPAVVGEAKKAREVQRWRNRAILAVLVLYLVAVISILTQLFLTSRRVDQLHQWQTQHAAALDMIANTQAAWKELQPVVDQKTYPLELLLATSAAIPADQLHLTLFQSNRAHILIKAEAKNTAAPFLFLKGLQDNASLDDYTWNMSQPHSLPNDLTTFQIDGTHKN